MALRIVRQDIVTMQVDAIVNAANRSLRMGGGVCGAIFKAAGAKRLQAACKALAPIETGQAVITPGFDLPARHIIHTAGPVYLGGRRGEQAKLHACYTNALALAAEHGCASIALPLISSGIYGYPRAEALAVAKAAIGSFLEGHDMEVWLVTLDKKALTVGETLLGEVARYIEQHYVQARPAPRRQPPQAEPEAMDAQASFCEQRMEARAAPFPAPATLEDLVGRLDESFSVTLLRLIDRAGLKDAQVYRRANIDRRLFSKIRGNPAYAPSKPTVLAFAVALELDLAQTGDLLARAGFALSPSRKLDVIVEYFIQNRRYDIFEINQVLFSYDQPLLGG